MSMEGHVDGSAEWGPATQWNSTQTGTGVRLSLRLQRGRTLNTGGSMRDARLPRSRGVDSLCGRRPEQADPQGQRGGQWWSGAGGGGRWGLFLGTGLLLGR